MSLERLLRDEEESILFLIGEEFGMNSIGYLPNGSNYHDQRHDHLCNCPGCNYDGPDPTDAEIQEWEQAMPDRSEDIIKDEAALIMRGATI